MNSKDLFVGQVAHIEGAKPGSMRYNPKQTDDERASSDNLILLCYPHHVEVDHPPQAVDVNKLKRMKAAHENRNAHAPFSVTAEVTRQAQMESEAFWDRVDYIAEHEHPVPELAVKFDRSANIFALLGELGDVHKRVYDMCVALSDAVPGDALWEYRNIGIPNFFTSLTSLRLHLELRALEMFVEHDPNGLRLRSRLAGVRRTVQDVAATSGYVD